MEKQSNFEFGEESPSVRRRTEPPRPSHVPRESTSLCAYCGMRMASALLDTTPPVDDNRWTIAAPYHAPTCCWVLTQGLRLDEGSHP
jgi:hypothetical protein